jgi:hypothetical protein
VEAKNKLNLPPLPPKALWPLKGHERAKEKAAPWSRLFNFIFKGVI